MEVNKKPFFEFLPGGGEMGELIRCYDWSTTSIGSPDVWPQSLRTTLSILLYSKFPMFLFWGDELLCFYNDAFRPSLGNNGKHPNSLGKPAAGVWPEIWHIIKPLIDQVLFDGTPSWSEDQLISIDRNGRLEDAYWTFSYSPVHDESGRPAAVFVTCMETTEKLNSVKHLTESKKLEFYIEATELATWDLNFNTNKFSANTRYYEWFGEPNGSDADNDLAFNVIADEDRQRVITAYKMALDYSSTIKYDIEYRICPPNKPERIVRAKGKVWFDEDKIAFRFNGTLQDITELVIAQKRTEENEKQLLIAVEGGELGTYDFCLRSGKLIWSDKNKEFYGLPPEAEVDYNIYLEGIHPQDRENSKAAGERALKPENGGLYENEFRTIGLSDGKLRWIRSKGKVIFDASGNPVRIIGVTQDITEQKELFASLQIQSLVLQHMDEGVSVLDENGIILLTNPAEDNMFGYAAGELTGKSVAVQNVYSAEENERIITNVISELKSKGSWSGEWHNRKKDGTEFFTYSYITLLEEDGKKMFVCVQRDITEEKQLKDTLIESEARFRTMANSIPQLSWMADAEGWIYWYNQRWYDFTGTTLEEMQGWGWQSVHHPDLLDQTVSKFKKAIAAGKPYEETFLLRDKHGEYNWFLTRALPIYNEKGQLVNWFGTNTDISGQYETEQALKTTKEQLELTFHNIPSGIYHFDKLGNILQVNEKAAKQMGYETVEDVLAENDVLQLKKKISETFEVLDEHGKPLPLNQFSSALVFNTGKPSEVVSQFIKRDDQVSFWLLSKSAPLFDENNELIMVLTTSTDITLQKAAEEKLRYRTALLEAHNEVSFDGILLVDAKGKIISFNQRFIEIWNMSQDIVDAKDDEAALSFAMAQLVHPTQFIDKVKYLYDNPTETSIDELEFLDGKIVERHGCPVVGEDGSYYAWSWTFRNITNQKIYETAIKESEIYFRQITELLPEKIINANAQGEINYFNQSWLNFTGLSLDELKEEGWLKVIHPDEREKITNQWLNSIKTGGDFEAEVRILNDKGAYKWHLNRAKAVKDENGTILKWIGTATEIQKMKEVEEHKSSFLKIVSHELKTPVTSIKGYVQFLLKMLKEEHEIYLHPLPLKSSLLRIDGQISRLSKLISEMLDMSRIEESKLELQNQLFSINEFIIEEVNDIRHTNLKHTINISHELNCSVYADRDRLGQVFINFVNNAIKYSPDDKSIDVRIHKVEPDQVAVSVKDFGIGIDKNDQRKIFDRFYRVEGKSENVFGGFGIGLFIANDIISRHHGSITLDSEKGKGSTFTFVLPYKD